MPAAQATRASAEFQRTKFRMRARARALILMGMCAVAAGALYWASPIMNPRITKSLQQNRRLDANETFFTCNTSSLEDQNMEGTSSSFNDGDKYEYECKMGWKPSDNEFVVCDGVTGNWTTTNKDGDTAECIDWYDGFKTFALGMTVDDIKGGGVIIFILLSLYMFLALSIVCDEYFVPALERMADAWSISDEIAGATLMAAGGSAPELFTSFIGTFTESSVGFGTIVGSAVFNVLFVIGMCAICSSGELKLTSWPLMRDSSYYCMSLVVLALFFGVLTENKIYWYEALILFILYIGYVAVMANNEYLHQTLWSSKKKKIIPEGVAAAASKAEDDDGHDPHGSHKAGDNNVSMNTPFTFRASILKMIAGQSSAADMAGVYAVTRIRGTMVATFKIIDSHGKKEDDGAFHGDGKIDAAELEALLKKVVVGTVTKELVDQTLAAVDTNKNGTVDLEEFKNWYKSSAHAVKAAIHAHFTDIDVEGSGMIQTSDTTDMLTRMKVDDVEIAKKECHAEAKWVGDQINREEFTDWFIQSKYLEKAMQDNKEEEEEGNDAVAITWPDTCGQRIMFIVAFPLIISLYCTVPDVRNPKMKNWFVASFGLSIAWIGIYSYVMVAWITMTGTTFNIPIAVMGLTFLAAGTSIPDLLSSVIVARKGLGDMAVSSSIGSNIFDVLVGLPLPWLSYGIYKGATDGQWYTLVVADTLFLSLVILFVMIALVIGIIIQQKWIMTKTLGAMMFLLYILFVAQDLLRTFM